MALFDSSMHMPMRRLERHSLFFERAERLIQRLSAQMALLLEYRTVTTRQDDDDTDSIMGCTSAIMDFYDQVGRRELYVRYLYRLKELHAARGDFAEVAFTLEHHARLLDWSDEPLGHALAAPPSAEAASATQRQLKERLYLDMIECFAPSSSSFDRRGAGFEPCKLWEFGIARCQELARLYEHDLFDYERLARILRKQVRALMRIHV